MGKKHRITETFSAADSTSKQYGLESNRREFLVGLTGAAAAAAFTGQKGVSQPTDHVLNLARVAVPSSLAVVSESKISAVNDGFIPESSFDRSHGLYALHGEWESEGGRSWVQYDWSEQVNINKIDVYWAVDHPKPGALPGTSSLHGMHVPESYRILYWNGNDFVAVKQPEGLGVAADAFNATTFTPVKTSKLRLEVTLQKDQPAGRPRVASLQLRPCSIPSAGDRGRCRPVGRLGRPDLPGGKGGLAAEFARQRCSMEQNVRTWDSYF